MWMGTLFKRISRPGVQAFLNYQRRSLVFKVERSEPELISRVKPTPYEFKNLSNLDDQYGHRFQIPLVQFYRNNVEMEGKDPAKMIKEAIAKALVFYYPFAGRLCEGLNDKLKVECTGEGVMFIEANADVRIEQLGDLCNPPFKGIQHLLYDGPGLGVILHSPLLLIQVTRLLCGGFVFALHLNHVMSDAAGVVQFLMAVGELARGAQFPSVQPVWRRELINARDPPQISCIHSMYHELNDSEGLPLDDVPQTHRSFFFSSHEIAVLRNNLPLELQTSTKFEILAACLWRSRTVSLLSPISDDKIGLSFTVNARTKLNPPLPVGYYGNAYGLPVALSTATKLCNNPLGYAVELIKKAKEDVTNEFMRSQVDLLQEKFPVYSSVNRTHTLSDQTRMGYNDVDFGWGKPIYGGPVGSISLCSFLLRTKNNKGDDGISISICLPGPAMEKFSMEIDKLITEPHS